MNLTAAVLIRTKNEAQYIETALQLVVEQTLTPLEVIVVDSGSTDETVTIVNQHPDIKLIEMSAHEFTFGRSLNIGFRATTADIVVSLSAHAFPCDRTWLEHLVKHFEHSTVAGVYGRQRPQHDAWVPVERECLDFYGPQGRVQRNPDNARDHIFSNANSAVRRQIWESLPFDEALSGCEDQAWAWNVLKRGYTIIYEPEAAVYHSHNESIPNLYQRNYREALAKKMLYQRNVGIMNALRTWYRSMVKDSQFIIKHSKDYRWLLWVPIYRFSCAYGQWCSDFSTEQPPTTAICSKATGEQNR